MAFMERITQVLEDLGPLGEGERSALSAMRAMARRTVLRKGDPLFPFGEVPASVAFVDEGMLRHVIQDSEGNERIVRFHRENEFVHDCERWARNEPTDFAIEAITECRLFVFELSSVHSHTEGHPGFHAIGARMMMGDRNALIDHVSMLQRSDPMERYKYVMEHDPELVQRVSVTHLAQFLGLTRETLSRVRSRIVERAIS